MGIRSVLVVALISFGALAGQTMEGSRLPDNPLDGLNLFEAKGCVQCHSIGAGGSHLGPNLGEGLFDGSFLDLGAALWNHVPGMSVTFEVSEREWPFLGEDEALDLLAFLYFIDYLGHPGDSEAGERVFRGSGGCASCHVIGGGGRGSGPDLEGLSVFASPLYVAQEIWNHGPAMMEAMNELGLGTPDFGERDLANLSAFIRQQAGPGLKDRLLSTPGNPNAGREVFASKGCVACHGEGGRGGGWGPGLSRYPLRRSAEAIAGTMWNHSTAMRAAMQARGIAWPRFEGTELADLVAFLYFLPFADGPGDAVLGEAVFMERACNDCHSSAEPGVGGASVNGPDLRRSLAASSPASLIAAMWNHAPVMRSAILREGRPWPVLSGEDLRDLRAFLLQGSG